MGRRLRGLVGALKDTASLGKAVAAAPCLAPTLAVLRATAHLPADPPHPRHIDALLAFGRGSRPSASALASSLADRLLSSRDPTVVLKSLLVVHHLLSRGAFIILDQLPAALLRHPSSGRNPLAFSSFPFSTSLSVTSCIRWYARLLELLISTSFFTSSSSSGGSPQLRLRSFAKANAEEYRLASLVHRDLISELEALVGIVEEMTRTPIAAGDEGNRLIVEVAMLVENDRVTAEGEILLRVKEVGHRLGSLGFAESVELVSILKRFKACRFQPSDRKPTTEAWYWIVVGDLIVRVDESVTQNDEGRRKVKRGAVSSSARITNRMWSVQEGARWNLLQNSIV